MKFDEKVKRTPEMGINREHAMCCLEEIGDLEDAVSKIISANISAKNKSHPALHHRVVLSSDSED